MLPGEPSLRGTHMLCLSQRNTWCVGRETGDEGCSVVCRF